MPEDGDIYIQQYQWLCCFDDHFKTAIELRNRARMGISYVYNASLKGDCQ